jgi:hypothetical protein
MPIPHRVEPPQRGLLSEEPALRDRLIDFIATRDCIDKSLARQIIGAMDVHQLTLLEIQARGHALASRKIDPERYRYGLPEIPAEPETDYHPFAR